MAEKVILLRGQSLAVGAYGETSELGAEWAHLADTYSPVQFAYDIDWPSSGTGDPTYTRGWGDLGPHDGGFGDFGPEASLGRMLPHDYRILKSAHGGTSLYHDWAHDSAATRQLWTRSNERVTERLAEVSGGATVAGVVWVQGTSDGTGTEARALEYGANLSRHIAELRSVYGAGIPVVFNRLHADNTATYADDVRAGQEFVVANVANVRMINTDDVALVDAYHHVSEGYAVMGQRLGAALIYLLTSGTGGMSTGLK